MKTLDLDKPFKPGIDFWVVCAVLAIPVLWFTKAGNVQLRCLLVNCAHYILGPFGPPSHLRAAGERIAQRGGKSAKKRAVIAVARKLAVTLLALWKSGADYHALPQAA